MINENTSLNELVNGLVHEADDFRKETPYNDDVTLFFVQIHEKDYIVPVTK